VSECKPLGVGGAAKAWNVLKWVFRWLPHYNVGKILYNLSSDAQLSGANQLGPWHMEAGAYTRSR
jgi:hypothetical protein